MKTAASTQEGISSGLRFYRGDKRYEISNHLGNVLVVVSDRKLWVSSTTVNFDHYLADLYSVQDYDPFGMGIPERSWAAEEHRFGFNGKEDDKEWQAQDYGERMYLVRLGRFPSPDPLIEVGQKYAELSPYQFASNTPVQAVDLDGLEKQSKVGSYDPATGRLRIAEYETSAEESHGSAVGNRMLLDAKMREKADKGQAFLDQQRARKAHWESLGTISKAPIYRQPDPIVEAVKDGVEALKPDAVLLTAQGSFGGGAAAMGGYSLAFRSLTEVQAYGFAGGGGGFDLLSGSVTVGFAYLNNPEDWRNALAGRFVQFDGSYNNVAGSVQLSVDTDPEGRVTGWGENSRVFAIGLGTPNPKPFQAVTKDFKISLSGMATHGTTFRIDTDESKPK